MLDWANSTGIFGNAISFTIRSMPPAATNAVASSGDAFCVITVSSSFVIFCKYSPSGITIFCCCGMIAVTAEVVDIIGVVDGATVTTL